VILTNKQKGLPNVSIPMVDVRDVAYAHIQALFSQTLENRNDRFLLSAESLWVKDIIQILKDN